MDKAVILTSGEAKKKSASTKRMEREAVWLERELALHNIVLPTRQVTSGRVRSLEPSGAPIGDPTGLHLPQGATIVNTVYRTHLSHTELDMYEIAKRGALFGLQLNEANTITISYQEGTNLLYSGGDLLETGCVFTELRTQLRERTLAILQHICGLAPLTVTSSEITLIVSISQLSHSVMHLLREMPFATECDASVGMLLVKYSDIAEGPPQPELHKLRFLFFRDGRIIAYGATCERALHRAYERLLVVLAPLCPRRSNGETRAAARKRRLSEDQNK